MPFIRRHVLMKLLTTLWLRNAKLLLRVFRKRLRQETLSFETFTSASATHLHLISYDLVTLISMQVEQCPTGSLRGQNYRVTLNDCDPARTDGSARGSFQA
jgi:hypothetical protein